MSKDKFKKTISVFLSVLLILTFISGCAKNQTNTTDAQPKEKIVTDGLGRQVKIPAEVKRIVTNYGIATHMVFALGAQDRLVGIDTPSKNNAFFNALKPEVAAIPSVGSPKDFNIEEAIALKPDLVLVPGRNRELVENLENRGMTVFGVIAEDLEQLKSTMENLGKALGEEEKAAQFIKYYDDTLKMVEQRTRGLKDEDKPDVYLVGPMGLLSTCSKDMYQNFLINLAGGKNVAANEKSGGAPAQGWFEVSPEQIIKWDPEKILVVQYTSGITPEQILSDPRFQEIKAVKNKQVFWFPSKLNPWDYPSPQAVLGIKWLAQKLHPDKFNDVNIQKEADEFFKSLYGKTFTEMGGTL